METRKVAKPGLICVVNGCQSKTGGELSFYRCPRNEQRCQVWKTLLGITGTHKYANLSPELCHSRVKVCSLHFSDASYTNDKKNRLNYNAVPTLLLPHLQWTIFTQALEQACPQNSRVENTACQDDDDSSTGSREMKDAYVQTDDHGMYNVSGDQDLSVQPSKTDPGEEITLVKQELKCKIDTEDVPDIIQIKTEPLNDSEFIDEEFNGSISHGNLDEDYIMRNPDHEHSLLEPKLDPHDDENSQSPISDSFSALNNVEIKQDVMETEDEFDIFGRHIAVQLRQLRIVNALKAQSKIQAILTELRIEEISKE